jgi:hypothetical protein
MTDHEIEVLEHSLNKVVQLKLVEGEIINARIEAVFPEEREIYYKIADGGADSAYVVHFSEIESVLLPLER